MSHCNLRTRRYRSNEEAVRPLDRHRHNRVLVPYSPLGRGFLTGAVTSTAGLGDTDYRHRDPRFADENAARNTSLVDRVVAVAARHNATPAQVALAWVLAQGEDVAPIPGTKRVRYLEQNADARKLALTADDLELLNTIAADTAGPRYSEAMMELVER